MKEYLEILKEIKDHGHDHSDRTGTGRRSVFSIQKRFNLANGFPMATTRYVNPMLPIAEILMFISGKTNVKFLNDLGLKFWDAWAVNEKTPVNFIQKMVDRQFIPEEAAMLAMGSFDDKVFGEFGPMYGSMWRYWPTTTQDINKATVIRTIDELPSDFVKDFTAIYEQLDTEEKEKMPLESWLLLNYYSSVDQLNELVHNLKNDPYSSRHLVTCFNPEFTPVPGFTPDENVLIGKGALMPCGFAFQCFVTPAKEEGGKLRLSLKWYQRSVDAAIGAVTNIAEYALLLSLLAHCTDMEAHEVIFDGGDVHLYLNHLEKVEEQLAREPLPLPTLWLNPDKKDLFAFTADDIRIEQYVSHPPIKYEVSI